MKQHGISSDSKEEFLGSATLKPIDIPSNFPHMLCIHECIRMRRNANDPNACSGFIYEDNICKLGYKDQSWIEDKSQDPGDGEATIFFAMPK